MVMWALAACLDHDPLPGDGDVFVAMQSDFRDFDAWPSVPMGASDTGHGVDERVVYAQAVPGDDAFGVGTRIVKTVAGGDTHAMVKRGGDFNADGAYGWEWFELARSTSGDPVIVWRGEAPPSGEAYGALPGQADDTGAQVGDCNTCHGAAAANDFVHADLGELR